MWRKRRSTANGSERADSQDTAITRPTATANPHSGASTMPNAVLITPDQTTALRPACATPAPSRPPISACELLVGNARSQLVTFHTIAPTRAPKITPASTAAGATKPVSGDLAT